MSQNISEQIQTIQKRIAKRNDANKRDRDEIERLERLNKQQSAKALAGSQVILNPNSSIQNPELRKLRGMLATVKTVGRKYHHVVFENGECWQLGFDRVVPATPEHINAEQQRNGQIADSVADLLNAGLRGVH